MSVKWQLSALYMANAIAITSTAYAHVHSSRLNAPANPATLHFLVGGVAFIVAALVSWWRPDRAYLAALAAAGISWLRYALSLLGFSFWGFLPLFTPIGFLTFLLPVILLYITTAYSYWGFVRAEQSSGFWQWLISRQPPRLTRLGVLFVLAVAGSITLFNRVSTKTTTHEMYWEIVQDITCPQMVQFAFVEARGYKVLACSNDLLNYLASSEGETIQVVFEVTYSLGVRGDFEIKQVGQWVGTLEESPRMQFSCSNVESACYGSQPGSPLTWSDVVIGGGE